MRKSPEIAPRNCARCQKAYTPSGNFQKYCADCMKTVAKERKAAWERRKYPNRKPKSKCQETCCICGGPFGSHFDGKPYCNRHYQRVYHYGSPDGSPRKSTNTFRIDGDVLTIETKDGETFLADAEEYEKLSRYSWCMSTQGYAVANFDGKVQRMHRYILGIDSADTDMVIDHKNHDRRDNRKENLRVCTVRENAWNQSGNVGRSLPVGIRLTKSNRYSARIMVDRKEVSLGMRSVARFVS